MTGQLSRSMHIACKYWQAERQYKMRCTRQLRQNLLLRFAEQPRFMVYKLLQLTVEVRSSEGGLCMAAPLQRSGEYDVFLKMSPSALDQRWTWTLVMSSCRINVRIPLTHRTCRTGHQPGFSRPPFHGGAESRVQIPELRVPMSPQMPHGPLSKHAAPRLRAAFCRVQSTITWLLTHSHDTCPSSAAAVLVRHCSLIHMIPAPPQRSAMCRGHSLIHMIPAPHQRLPCLEDTALLFARYQPHISGCLVWKTLLSYSHDTSPPTAVCRV